MYLCYVSIIHHREPEVSYRVSDEEKNDQDP
jgi:hypothetical protein